MSEEKSIKYEKHVITIPTTSETWDLFRSICDVEERKPGQQIGRYLALMHGIRLPNYTCMMLNESCFAIEKKLYRVFSLFQDIEQDTREPDGEVAKIIPFPARIEGA